MKSRNFGIENRKYPRIEKRLKFKIRTDGFETDTETINLSCIGVSCHIKEKIPYMTRLRIVLALPCSGKKRGSICVECYGVVVRVEKIPSKPRTPVAYHVAIFFSEIDESEREKLSEYIEEML